MRSIFAEISNNEVVNVSKCNQMLSKNMNCETFLYFLILQIWRSPVKSRNLFCSAVIQMMSYNVCYTVNIFRKKTLYYSIFNVKKMLAAVYECALA